MCFTKDYEKLVMYLTSRFLHVDVLLLLPGAEGVKALRRDGRSGRDAGDLRAQEVTLCTLEWRETQYLHVC